MSALVEVIDRAPMSSPDRQLVISPDADQDLSDALLYSQQRWGRSRRTAYEADLFSAMRTLTRFPHLGRSRADILPNLRSHPVGEHVILYEVDEQTVTILRILHARMDIETVLDEG